MTKNKMMLAVCLTHVLLVSTAATAADYAFRLPAVGLKAAVVVPLDPLTKPADKVYSAWDAGSATATLTSDGLTAFTAAEAVWRRARGSVGLTTGKWYWEMSSTVGANARYTHLGISDATFSSVVALGDNWSGDSLTGYTAGPAWGARRSSTSANDTLMVALDMDAKTVTFGQNGQWWSGPSTLVASFAQSKPIAVALPGTVFPFGMISWSGRATTNLGQAPFKYPVPEGYHAGVWQR